MIINVLIVEDDPMVVDINSKFLRKIDGFNLLGAVNSIDKAKDFIENKSPDLIILDMFFPKEHGIDLIKWLRNSEKSCDVIFITADNNNETVEEAFRYGAVDYLVKPFVFERFKKSLQRYASRKVALTKDNELEQKDIDVFTTVTGIDELEHEIGDFESLKGFSHHTYDKIISMIEKLGDKSFTSNEIAELIGVSRITARRYLDYLERKNVLEIEHQYGKIGRPQNKYKLRG